ncbi:ABC transporter permease subunit [Acidipropionibacterium timonense]|uniref:ABC transporter permease subunit n=1 Tax=Acidipropionibacterium timonense TaxID=2161818 RepID=UPI001031772A|nr:allose ABC transporter [Acidipropionibacterium timonense]
MWSNYGVFMILILVFAVFAIIEPAFLMGGNPIRIIDQSTIYILLGFGEFFAILLAGIDLSIGSTMALTGVVTAQLMSNGMPWLVASIVGILIGVLIGIFNAIIINLTHLHPFIVTLGTQSILRGMTYVMSNATAISISSAGFSNVVAGSIAGYVPATIVLCLLVLVVLMLFTGYTTPGRNLYAMGGNPQSAWYAGINSPRHTILAFAISGACAGLAGLVNVARLGAAEPNAGTGYETFAIAAVIIAGTSFFGGEGVIWKVLFGALIIGTINNGLNMVGVSSFYQQIAMGTLIIVAVTVDHFFGPRAARRS